eukprot:SAG11_NODE_18496_length_489_cov_1.061538_2_plen_73_part_01
MTLALALVAAGDNRALIALLSEATVFAESNLSNLYAASVATARRANVEGQGDGGGDSEWRRAGNSGSPLRERY